MNNIIKFNNFEDNNVIPTAKEFLREKYNSDINSFQDNVEHIQEFTKLHVEAALKEAKKKYKS